MKAHAKLNLALVVGPLRPDGKHEVVTVYQRIALADDVTLEPSEVAAVEGFDDDTLVRAALCALAEAARVEPRWRVRIEKRIPVAAGLGGGSSDAATALRLANETLAQPLDLRSLERLAARVGADVPFFLREGPQLGRGDGSDLEPLDLQQDYAVVLVLPHAESKHSTADVYAAFDARAGADRWRARRTALLHALERGELDTLPPNDLASSPHAEELRRLGAFRADVSGAGPTLFGLFETHATAAAAATQLERLGRVWITAPAW